MARAVSDVATRRWRLRGWTGTGKDQKLFHQSTCRGDRALDDAMKRLERDPQVTRIAAEYVG